ncbi:unnamed protein product [Brassicogethes aeneus]|uniref:Uncharacterized protein n=1 Tax=Brassicogethes aeneus TaxID=1431903 RepID=A0A9P0BFB9_BRAAE|nr:unnamed protein product [Brassicogethes aeneus]
MLNICIKILSLLFIIYGVSGDEVLGCGGFLKSHVQIDFSKVVVKLLTKQGILKDKTNCAPNNGYYFVPLYEKGEYTLELEPPRGWSFTPPKIDLKVDGKNDLCSQGRDINFEFKGFGIAGKVESLGMNLDNMGPSGVQVELISSTEKRVTNSDKSGHFSFTPVYPGTYTVSISHNKWKILKKSIKVKVTEGNTELASGSLVVQGYDVKGKVFSNGDPMKNTVIVLLEKAGTSSQYAEGCLKDKLQGLESKEKQICHVKTNGNGEFVFPVLPNGKYSVVPYVGEKNIFFQPKSIEFNINHESLELKENFEVSGFSINGFVYKSENQKPIVNARVLLNNREVARTDKNGYYKLENIQANTYKLRAESDGFIFAEKTLNINPNLDKLPNIIPSSYRVCGKVLSDEIQTIKFSKIGSSVIQTSTDQTGKFCEFLPSGKYEVEVNVNNADQQKGLQFFPIKQTIVVSSEDIPEVVFSQLKATVSGTVRCIRPKDCEDLTVTLKSQTDESDKIDLKVSGNSYVANHIFPGHYDVVLHSKKLCWVTSKQSIFVNSAQVEIPAFVQTGYLVNFVVSHGTKINYKNTKDNRMLSLNLNVGNNEFCVENPGEYHFVPDSCHIFDKTSYVFNTDKDMIEIVITAKKHKVSLDIDSVENHGNILATVKIGEQTTTQTLAYSKGKYEITLLLGPSDEAMIVPKSDILYFNPPVLSVPGHDDCKNLGKKFSAIKGRVFKGKVQPALSGVIITVESDVTETLTVETAEDGSYKFPALDDSNEYTISAKKESYILLGPDNNGNFKAHKLAEIIVDVLDEADNIPLQGALLSLSGGESYRSNLQTNDNGRITFHSLSPSDYFLRPMMKEYKFDPLSKMIKVKEGESVSVKLIGKRVAYSTFGQIMSLNGEPEENMVVIAAGTGNCSHFSEETISESTGSFRIRGLQPYCSYDIQIKQNAVGKNLVDRSVPNFIHIENVKEDVKDLKIIVFRPVSYTDVMIKVLAQNIEHYKSLRLKVARESSTVILNTKIDTSTVKITKDNNPGVLIHLPSLPSDDKPYTAHLESTLPGDVKTISPIGYFNTNSSFQYLELTFAVKTGGNDQHIKQTSVWTLLIFIGIITVLYNIELVAPIVKDKFNFNLEHLSNYMPTINKKTVDNYDNAEIDQIVQSINNLKKKKPVRKI